MFELLVILAVTGSVVAGIWDLFTTEVPDEIPALMIVLGLSLLLIESASKADFTPLIISLMVGTVLLLAGIVIYKKGGWGGADTWILAAIGYMVPVYNSHIFMIDYLPNFLIVSAAYMVVYALILGMRNRSLFSYFGTELKLRWKVVVGAPIIFIAAVILITASFSNLFASINLMPVFLSSIIIFLLTIFWVYAKVIEKHEFKKRIPVGKLKAGDVLENMVWRGITEEELREIRKAKRYVVIKEGVRFVPVFPITLVITLLYGGLLFGI